MGFMDKLKEAAQDVASEAKKATAQGKVKLDQIQTRKKADDAARRLGYLIHAERTRGATSGPEADGLIAEISRLEAEIAAAQAEEASGATGPAATTDASGASAPQASPQRPPAPPTSSEPTPGDFKL
jgi:septal ring factor EnvC (AmiA/AmiB activator)